MNNADLVWRLVELLLQKEKDGNQAAPGEIEKTLPLSDRDQNEA